MQEKDRGKSGNQRAANPERPVAPGWSPLEAMMESFCERLEALEQQTAHWKQQTHALARQARWWRGIAWGLGLLGLMSLPLQW